MKLTGSQIFVEVLVEQGVDTLFGYPGGAVLIVFSVIGWIMAWTKRELNRKEGIIMLLLYAVYVVYICMR